MSNELPEIFTAVDIIKAFLFGGLLFLVINGIFFSVSKISLTKNEWKCSETRIVDSSQIDNVECIKYEKLIKNEY